MKKRTSILESFIEAISGFTGLHICVYDLAYFTRDDEKLALPSPLREHCSPYCKKIKSTPEGWDCCKNEEYFRAAQAQKRNAPFLHTCHAGLSDLIVPIRRGGKQIGAIYLGQAVTGGKMETRRSVSRLARKFGFARDELVRLLSAQPHISGHKLQRYATLLNGLRDYVELSETVLGYNQIARGITVHPGQTQVEMKDVPTFFLDQLRPQSENIQKALDLLKIGYWQKISLARVAREVGLSESHFTREFRRETGFTFRKCLVETRINAALFLLKRSHLTVGQIAEMIGYEDVSSMGRAFRKQVGASPKQFMRMQPPPWLVDDLANVHFPEKQKIPD